MTREKKARGTRILMLRVNGDVVAQTFLHATSPIVSYTFRLYIVCAGYQSNYSQTLSRIARVTFRAGRIPRRAGQP